jgi:hypothetical protein
MSSLFSLNPQWLDAVVPCRLSQLDATAIGSGGRVALVGKPRAAAEKCGPGPGWARPRVWMWGIYVHGSQYPLERLSMIHKDHIPLQTPQLKTSDRGPMSR